MASKSNKPEVVNGITIPEKVKLYTALGFIPNGQTGMELYGDCLFCKRENKLYINAETQQWSCKSAHCAKKGNHFGFMAEIVEAAKARDDGDWQELGTDRSLPVRALKAEGIVYDSNREQWLLPVYSEKGSVLHVYRYRIGRKGVFALKTISHAILGLRDLCNLKRAKERVFVAEGPWDVAALKELLKDAGIKAVVVGIPGSGVLKSEWVSYFNGRDVVWCFDNDEAGRAGTKRAWAMLKGSIRSFACIHWPEGLPEGFDIRDFRDNEGTFGILEEYVDAYEPSQEPQEGQEDAPSPEESFPALSKKRPTLDWLLGEMKAAIPMNRDTQDAFRVILAVLLSNWIPGPPLWIHIAAASGSGKTLLLSTTIKCPQVEFVSTLGPHTLVSGWAAKKDPSLLPKLIGPPQKVLVLKDYTEILQMQKASKDEILTTLRGAYDGEVTRVYGNDVTRYYKGYFSMVTGTTPSVYKEAQSALGERFLIFYMPVDLKLEDAILDAAIFNVGKENNRDSRLQDAVLAFMSYRVNEGDLPEVPEHMKEQIKNLARLTAQLRATVEKDRTNTGSMIHYRPQAESPARLVGQYVKLLMGLGLQRYPAQITEEDMRILTRVALSTSLGWSVEIVRQLVKQPGATIAELERATSIPGTTIRDHMENLILLGVVEKRKEEGKPAPSGFGAPAAFYHLSQRVEGLWQAANVDASIADAPAFPTPRRKPTRETLAKAAKDPRAAERVGSYINHATKNGRQVPKELKRFKVPGSSSGNGRNGK